MCIKKISASIRCHSHGHKSAKITPLIRREITERLQTSLSEYGRLHGKVHGVKYLLYAEMAHIYRVHINTIKKIFSRGKHGDCTLHKSEREGYRVYARGYARQAQASRSIQKRQDRAAIVRYEKEYA